MKPNEFDALRNKAVALFNAQPKANRISLDAVFTALAASEAVIASKPAPKVRKVGEDPAPEWFNETLAKLRETGATFNVGRFLMLAGKFPATHSESISAGRWLRAAGLIPRKTSGQNIYEIPPPKGKGK